MTVILFYQLHNMLPDATVEDTERVMSDEGEAPSNSPSPGVSDLTVHRLWSEHYNDYYWYYYDLFKQGLAEEGSALEVSTH